MPRESLLNQLNDKGLLTKPEGMSVGEYMGFQKGRMVESKEGITSESKLGEDVILLSNSRMLDDGSYIQNFTDISEIKKHEELIESQRERFDRVLGDLEAIVFESDLKTNQVTYEIPEALKEIWGDSSRKGSQEDGYRSLRKDFVGPYKALRAHKAF